MTREHRKAVAALFEESMGKCPAFRRGLAPEGETLERRLVRHEVDIALLSKRVDTLTAIIGELMVKPRMKLRKSA